MPELLPKALGDWIKQMPPPWGSYMPAVLCLGIFTSVRVAEQVRAGIQSLPRGQRMAGTALGLTLPQTYRYVLLPMAFRIILPPLTSEFMNIIKNSSVALTIGLLELTGRARADAGVQLPGVRGVHRGDDDLPPHQPHRRARSCARSSARCACPGFIGARAAPPQAGHSAMDSPASTSTSSSARCGYLFREGMTFTLTLTALAMTGGIIFGTLLAMMRLSAFKPLSCVAGAYVNLMRSIPLVLVIFWFFFLVPYIGAWIIGANAADQVGAFWSAVITFTMFEAAYYCEIMRAGIQSIPRGQVSAGLRARPQLLADDGHDRAAAGVPQHAAGAAHADRSSCSRTRRWST